MKGRILLLAIIAGISMASCVERAPLQLGPLFVKRIINAMTLEEKLHLLVADSSATYAIPRLGIPAITLADATDSQPVTALTSTWNMELMRNVGKAMGCKARDKGPDVLFLSPINIQTAYYAEDPLLIGRMAGAMVEGIQSGGVGASLKYLGVNNSIGDDNRLTPRALREIYLKGFEVAVKESQPNAVITSHAYINGMNASQSRGLLRIILHDEWEFKGAVISQRPVGNDLVAQLKGGTDLLMNGGTAQIEEIRVALDSGKLKESDINRAVENILKMILGTPHFTGSSDSGIDASACESAILLKNTNQALPVNNPDDAGLIVIEKTFADFELTRDEVEHIHKSCINYRAAGKKAIVWLKTKGIVETASWKHLPDAILMTWNDVSEEAVLNDLLTGKVNPSGKLPVTLPMTLEPKTDMDYVVYTEDVFVGYRYYDTFRKEVSYPFGFGLSYTTFTYDNPTIHEEKGEYTVTIDVTNTGKYAGKEVVQLYVSAPMDIGPSKPLKELKAFAKTNELQPGEKETLTMRVSQMELASFNDAIGAWVVDRGSYKFLIGASSQDIRQMISTEISESIEKNANGVLLPRGVIETLGL